LAGVIVAGLGICAGKPPTFWTTPWTVGMVIAAVEGLPPETV